jgi:DNA-binding GntR family transcriptional regulator
MPEIDKTDMEYTECVGVSDRTHQTYHRLREMIISGELPSGYHLKQVHLARMLHISQTPVREAMKLLEREGWVDRTFNKGATVRAFSRDDLRDAYEVREMLEGLTARKAAALITDGQVTQLRELALVADEWSMKADLPLGAVRDKADMDFHMNLATLVGNRQVMEVFQRLLNLEMLFRTTAFISTSCKRSGVVIRNGPSGWPGGIFGKPIRSLSAVLPKCTRYLRMDIAIRCIRVD